MTSFKFAFALLFMCSTTLFADYTETIEAFWDFETINSTNNQLVDLSGRNNYGYFRGGVPDIIDGKVGKCMRFDGTKHIELNNHFFMENQCNLTMTSWIKIEGSPTQTYQLFCISNNEPWLDPMTFQFINQKPSDFAFEDCLNGTNAIRSNPKNFKFKIEPNEWYFLTVVLCSDNSSTNMKIYLNGELAETVNILSTMETYQPIGPGKLCPTFHTGMYATIGALYNYKPWHWVGCIDNMKFFKTCLTENEIMQEYLTDCDSSAFEYNNASEMNANLKLNGDAKSDNSTFTICPSAKYNIGSAWQTTEVPVAAGFTTNWVFSVDSSKIGTFPDASEPGADGIAFVIQNSYKGIEAIGAFGGGMGYEGIDNALAIEIDLFANDSYQLGDKLDPNGNHLAVMGTTPKTVLQADHSPKYQIWSTTALPTILGYGTKYYAKADYNAIQKTLDVWISETPVFGDPNIHLSNFNIKSYLSLINGTHAYVGFTSATGVAYQNHNLHSWSFCPKPLSTISDVSDGELSTQDIISPNPASNLITINLPEEFLDFPSVEIFNMLGQSVYSSKLFGKSEEIDVSNIDNGVYFLVIQSGIFTKTSKLVIQH